MNATTQALYALLLGMTAGIKAFIKGIKDVLIARIESLEQSISALTQSIGKNMHSADYTLTEDTSLANIVTAVLDKMQNGYNEIVITATDEEEFTVAGLPVGAGKVGHLDRIRFDFDTTTSAITNVSLIDDRTTQRIKAILDTQSQQGLNIAQIQTLLATNEPELYGSSF